MKTMLERPFITNSIQLYLRIQTCECFSISFSFFQKNENKEIHSTEYYREQKNTCIHEDIEKKKYQFIFVEPGNFLTTVRKSSHISKNNMLLAEDLTLDPYYSQI